MARTNIKTESLCSRLLRHPVSKRSKHKRSQDFLWGALLSSKSWLPFFSRRPKISSKIDLASSAGRVHLQLTTTNYANFYSPSGCTCASAGYAYWSQSIHTTPEPGTGLTEYNNNSLFHTVIRYKLIFDVYWMKEIIGAAFCKSFRFHLRSNVKYERISADFLYNKSAQNYTRWSFQHFKKYLNSFLV